MTWPAFLADIEQRLDLAETGLPFGIVDVAPFVAPPAELGDLPIEYREWAAALLQRTNALQAELARSAAEVGRQLAASRRQPPVAAPLRPAFFDASV